MVLINQSLVDSNMLLRSVFLSIDFFVENCLSLSRNKHIFHAHFEKKRLLLSHRSPFVVFFFFFCFF